MQWVVRIGKSYLETLIEDQFLNVASSFQQCQIPIKGKHSAPSLSGQREITM